MTDAWVGVDLGTQSARVVVLGDDGAVLHSGAGPLTSRRDGDRHEQDPAEWLRVTTGLIRAATAALPSGTAIRALAVDGTSGTLVPVDDRGRPAGPAAMYDDRRGAPWLDRVAEAGDELWRRLGYRMQATWALPKLLAMRDENPAEHWAHQPDVILSALAGRSVATDLSSALKTGADLDAIAWPGEMLGRLGVDPTTLPALAATGEVVGEVSPDAAAETGLPAACALVAGATDGIAAQLAAGAIRPGQGGSVLGTTLVLKGVSTERRPDPEGAVYSHRAPFEGGWYPGGASSTGARAVSALLPGRDLDAVTRAAAELRGIPVAYPLLGTGERFPIVADGARGFWPGDPSDLDDAELFRAIAFGVAFLERRALERMSELGAPIRSVAATGGGARNAWWLGVRAAVSRREFRVPQNTEGAAGMALLAAAALGPTPSDLPATASRMLPSSRAVDPVVLDEAAVEDAYAEFTARLDEEAAR